MLGKVWFWSVGGKNNFFILRVLEILIKSLNRILQITVYLRVSPALQPNSILFYSILIIVTIGKHQVSNCPCEICIG